jgi:hypothetical protein
MTGGGAAGHRRRWIRITCFAADTRTFGSPHANYATADCERTRTSYVAPVSLACATCPGTTQHRARIR